MTTLTDQDINTIAKLAKLHPLADQEKQCRDFNKLLHLFEQVEAVDTEGIEPLSHPIESMSQPLRADVVAEEDQHQLFQSLAPATEANVYLVPAAIKDKKK